MNAVPMIEDARQAVNRLFAGNLRDGYRIAGCHRYNDAEGRELFRVARLKHPEAEKIIRPMHRSSARYRTGRPERPATGWPLYVPPYPLVETEPVFVVEGEACADTLARLGLTAVTSGNADSAEAADWTPLQGRRVRLWPDHDGAGARYAGKVEACLRALGCVVERIDAAALHLPDKGDCVDWLQINPQATADDVRGLVMVEIEKQNRGAAVAISAVSAVEPEPFEDDTPPTPWPDDCLPPGMEGAARAIAEHVKAPKALAGLSVLSAVAHAAMRLVDADHPMAGAMPCSLFTLVAGQSGDRKSACFKLATWPVSKREKEMRNRHKAEVLEIEQRANNAKPAERKAIKAEIPPDPRTIFVDATTQKIEHTFVRGSAPALSLSTDEGGTLLGGHSLKSETRAASLSALTRLFDGGGVQRDRIGEDQSGFRFDIRFGLFLLAQPIVLAETLDDPLMRDQGFLPRFIYAAPDSLAGTRFPTEADLDRRAADDGRVRDYWRMLRALDEIPPTLNEAGDLRLSPADWTREAKRAWLNYYCRTEARQGVDGDMHHLRAFAGRAGELVVRVATVYAVWRSAGGIATVEAEDVERAGLLVDYSLSEWARQSGPCLTPAERDARDLLALIHRKGWSTVTRVLLGQYAPNALRKSTRRRNDAIEALLERGWLLPGDGGNMLVQNSRNSKNSNSNPQQEVFRSELQGNLEAFDL